jgi:phage gp29-like protein
VKPPTVLDRFGRPLAPPALTPALAAPVFGSFRSPTTGYPADGLTPERLASILREADVGQPVRYLELLEFMEERETHYAAVIATRRRSVMQLPITVEAFSEAPEHEADADQVRAWLKRGILQRAFFDILDCLPKGYSITEIRWAEEDGLPVPAKLERRDPRWFRFDRTDLSTPVMLTPEGQTLPLETGRFIYARIGAKSGLPLRSGLGRIALWSYLFKMYAVRDWQQFLATYGQPLRLGKYGAGATEKDKDTLFDAVANIAGDCAAIVPESMTIEFIAAGALSATGELFERRSDWIDKQVSKLVLGQTATTDAVTGGLGSGKEHRQVQEDIERADAAEISSVLSDQLIAPWMGFRGRDPAEAPRLLIARPEEENLEAFGRALAPFIDRGLRVPVKAIRDKFSLPEPEGEEEVLMPAGSTARPAAEDGKDPVSGAPVAGPARPSSPRKVAEKKTSDGAESLTAATPAPTSKIKRDSGEIKRGNGVGGRVTDPRPEGAPAAKSGAPGAVDLLTDRLAFEAAPAAAAMLDQIGAMFEAAGSGEELLAMIHEAGFDLVNSEELAQVLTEASLAAGLHGRVDAQDEGETA